MKKSKIKIFSIILFTLISFGIFALNAEAAGEHKFSFKAWQCGSYDSSEEMCAGPNGDYPMPEELPSITLGNGSSINPGVVNAGDLIQLAVYYEPGTETFWSMSAFVIYDPDLVEPLHNSKGGLIYTQTSSPYNEDTPGPYPPEGESGRALKRTLWEVSANDSQASHNITSVIQDGATSLAERQYLENSGSLYYVYFKVKDDVEPGTVITFSYNMDPGKTKIANNAPVISEVGTLQVYKELDTDTSLSGIEVKNGTTNYLTSFNKNTKTYDVYVPNSVDSVTVTGTPTKETTSAVTVPSGSQNLAVSTSKQFVITTTAESGDTDTYTVNVYRLDNNANLTALSLGSGVTLTPTFASGTTSYTASVPYAISSVNVSATKESSKASISGTGSKNLTAGGVTNVSVVVTPENCGSAYSNVPGNTCTTKTYTVAVTRAAADTNAYLTDLKIAGVSVPGFSKTTYEYTIDDVSNATTSVTVAPTKESNLSTLSGDTTSKSLAVGNNQIKVTVTAEDGTTKHTYTVNVKRKSNDANLKTLTVTSTPSGTLSPASFSPSTTSYTYTVGPDVTEVQISATPNYDGASVVGTGTYNPNTDTEAQIIVTPEDGEAKVYTVNLVRTKSTDVTLDELSAAGYTISPSYSDSVNSYNVTVPSTASSVNVTATPHDSRTTATVSGGTNLTTGNNTVTVTVTPENGASSARTITITVKKLDGDATLKTLSLSGVTITPTFASGTKEYTATVPYTTSSTTVSATTNKTTTTITSGTGSVNLTAGAATTIKVKTKAEDPNVTDEYTVVVTRTAAATDNTLLDLKVDGVTVPGFDPDVTTYTLDAVASTKESVEITATLNNEFATIVSGTGSKTLTKNQNNVQEVVVRSQAGVNKTYTINIRRQNDNAFLSSLNITSSDGSLDKAFNKNTLAYTYTVGPDVTSVEITGVCEDTTNATVSGNGTIDPRTVTSKTIRCTAEDTNVYKDYVITIVRNKSTNVKLSNLVVEGYDINFDPDTNTYNLNIDSNVESITVTATKGDERQTLSDDTQVVTTNNPGDYQVNVTVTAEDTTKTNTYTVNVHKYSADASLQSLALDGITLSPVFNANTTEYTATVPYTKESTTITATPISGASIVDGSDLGAKALVVGNTNVFTITVKAEDDHTTRAYTVTVNRLAASGNAYLTDLKVDGTTVPGFDGENVFTYTLDDVASTKDKITISATPNENSTIRVGDTGEKALNIGDNSFEVVVIAQNGQTRIPYTINIKRLDNNNKLTNLTITSNPQGSLDNSFDPDTNTYTYTVGPDVNEIVITATSTDGTTVTGTGTYDPNDTNTVTITVTPEDPNAEAKTYTINLVREESTNNKLSDLTIDGTTVDGFDPDTTTYNVTVPSDKDTISVGATAEDTTHANVSGSGDKTLQTGNNPIVVTVTAEDGTPKEYTINVYKENDDNTLSNLTLDNVTFDQTFDPNVTEYTAIVPYTTENTTVNATPNDTNANVLVTGSTDLSVGENTFTIVVTPEDENATPKTYTVTVTRLDVSTDAYLTDLKVNGTSVPGFNKDIRTYNIEVGSSIASAEITATANELSTVSGDIGTKQLNVGTNTFVVNAVAQDGNTTTPYTVNIKRLDSNNNLEDLTITSDPAGSLDKPFDPDTTEYTYTVGPNTGDITVTADPEGSATVEGEGTYDPKTTDTITITVTPEDGEPKEYVIHINREKSTNADLLSLGVEGYSITPTFDKDVTSYTLTVPRDVDKATITAEKADSNATINASDLGEKSLNPGANTFTVTVVPEDPNASSKTYTIVITRTQGTDGTLSSITVDGEPITGFDPSILEYTLPDLPSDTETITIGATPTDDNANVSGDGVVTLTPGENRIPITVTPEDPNAEPVTYTLIVNKELDDNIYLKNLLVNGTSVPEFNKETNTYSVNVPIDAETVSITAEPEAETSTVSGTGAQIALTGDSTEITITVTSQKGTENPYVVTVNKVDDAEFITSIAYGHTIEDGMIKTVIYKSKSNELKDQLDNDNSLLFMYKADDSEIYSDDEPLATGVIVKLIRNNNLKDSKLVVVKGDVDGNGRITLFDAVKVLNHFLEKEILEGIYFEAADVDSNGSITLFDAVGILRIFLNDNE